MNEEQSYIATFSLPLVQASHSLLALLSVHEDLGVHQYHWSQVVQGDPAKKTNGETVMSQDIATSMKSLGGLLHSFWTYFLWKSMDNGYLFPIVSLLRPQI